MPNKRIEERLTPVAEGIESQSRYALPTTLAKGTTTNALGDNYRRNERKSANAAISATRYATLFVCTRALRVIAYA